MSLNPHKYLTRKWIMMRMAAQEFSFKEPFDLDGEYRIMKSCLFLSINPIELIFVFTYARLYGALGCYSSGVRNKRVAFKADG